MSKTLSFKHYLLISAYIDGRCSAHEKDLVESLTAKDPEFARALVEFSRSKKMLKAVPRVRAPRSFTLSAADVPQVPRRFFLAPALNYGALAAAVLCIFLFAGTRLLPLASMSKAAAPQAAMMAASDESRAVTPTLMPMISWGMQGGLGGGGGGAEGSGLPRVYATAPAVGSGGPTTGLVPGATEAPMLAQPSSTATPEPASNPSNLILGVPDVSAQGKVLTNETPSVKTPVVVDWVLVGEVGLSALSVGLALAAWLLRRRH